jgi:carboxypeptidase Taq
MQNAYKELRGRLATISDLSNAAAVLEWDQQTMMPREGGAARADQLGTLARVTHELASSAEIGRLLDAAGPWTESLDPDSDEACLVRVVRRDYEKTRRVPAELRAEMTRAASLAVPVWAEARRRSDWGVFLPHLEHALELRRRYVACFDPAEEAYDILLDDFEPGMKTAEVRAVFAKLKAGLVPLIADIAERADAVDDSILKGTFPVGRQQQVESAVLGAFGFTRDSWRLDETVHPFATQSGPDDIRLTTRHQEGSLDALFGTMHEFGHGLYEHGVDRSLCRTPLAGGASLGIHESQSRMWENLVGRSRPFWQRFFPEVQAEFPDAFRGVDAERFYRAVNRVRPSLIRITADEATYNLHIILRFELEQAMLSGEVSPPDVPEAWEAKVRQYLGIHVTDVAAGALQDTHWASGYIGYFPTYALGNIISAQIWERIHAEIPDLDGQIRAGEFAALREWLRDRVHRHGRKYMPKDLLRRVTGSGLDSGPLLRYLRDKLGGIYGLEPHPPAPSRVR